MRQHKVLFPSVLRLERSGAETCEQRRARRISAFASELRPLVEAVGAGSPRREDLADSFPGLLFAIATGYASVEARRRALTAVDAGLPLREAAERLGLPFWLRKLPAQAFQAPLTAVPSDAALAGRLTALIPAQPGAAAGWLQRVLAAHHTGRPDLAVWVAHNWRAAAPAATSPAFLRTLGWAWFAGRPETRGSALLTTRWMPALGARRAAAEAQLWRERVELDVCLGAGLADTWLVGGPCRGYDIVPLRTTEDFLAEAKAMDNCLDRYADKLTEGAVRVFSIRRDGRPVADLAVSTHAQEAGMPAITQLRVAHNRPAGAEIWQVAYSWLGGQPLRKAPPGLKIKVSAAERQRRLAPIWMPFLEVLPADARQALATAVLLPTGRKARGRASS